MRSTRWTALFVVALFGSLFGQAVQGLAILIGWLPPTMPQLLIGGALSAGISEVVLLMGLYAIWRVGGDVTDEAQDVPEELVARVEYHCGLILAEQLLPPGNAWYAQQGELDERASTLLRMVVPLLPEEVRASIEEAIAHHKMLERGQVKDSEEDTDTR